MVTPSETVWDEARRSGVPSIGLRLCTLYLKFREDRVDEVVRRCIMDRKRISGIDRRKGTERRNTARLIDQLRWEWYSCHGQGD